MKPHSTSTSTSTLILTLFLFTSVLFAQQKDFTSYFEKTNGKETPRYAETVAYCKLLAASSKQIKYMNFGKTPQGREMPLLILDKNSNFTPEAIKKSGNIVLLIQAAIHAGEPDGKDAVLMLIRDIAIYKKMTSLLDHVTLLFIPIYNADGHERFSKYNRINQNGPAAMGWRCNANSLNLNRDYLKADAIETKNWLRLFNRFMPDFFIDCHTTDGADYQYVITYDLETEANVDESLQKWQKENYLAPLTQLMNKEGLPIFPYVTFRNWHDPRSGLVGNAAPPMLSQGYTIQRNRPGLLIETHMLKPYKQRVEATYKMIEKSMLLFNKEYQHLHQCIAEADQRTAGENFRKNAFAINFDASEKDSSMIDFLGVEYTMEKSDLSGGEWFKYDNTKPVSFKIPYFHTPVATAKVRLPKAYIIAVEWTDVIALLKLHNISMKTIDKPLTVKIQTYKFKNMKWSPTPYEGRHPLNSFDLDTIETERTYPAGSVIIDMNQAAARIIAYLLEPRASGSLAYWGFFDDVFQQKEYAESYVMEVMAREMLAKDASLQKEFEQKKTEDAEFAKNPRAILNWFYSKTPYWDKELNVYPVGKIY